MLRRLRSSKRRGDNNHDGSGKEYSRQVVTNNNTSLSTAAPYSDNTNTMQRYKVVTPPSTTSNNATRHERARQKLDALSRQHYVEQYGNNNSDSNQYYNSTSTTPATTPSPNRRTPTNNKCESETEFDTSSQLERISSYDKLMNNSPTKQYHTRSMPTSPGYHTTNSYDDEDDSEHLSSFMSSGIAASSSGLESSYYSKHDFHNIPKKFIEDERLLLNDNNNNNGGQLNNASYQNNSSNVDRGVERKEKKKTAAKRVVTPVCILHSSTDYKPTPPSKRQGGGNSSNDLQPPSQQRRNVATSKGTAAISPTSQVQKELIQNDYDYYQPIPPTKRSTSFGHKKKSEGGQAAERRRRVGKNEHEQQNELEGYDQQADLHWRLKKQEQQRNDQMPDEQDNSKEFTPDTIYDNVQSLPAAVPASPSPEKKKEEEQQEEEWDYQPKVMTQQSKNVYLVPIHRSTDEPETEVEVNERLNKSVDAPGSTAPTEKVNNNSSHLIGRLLRRQVNNKNKPKAANRMQTFQQRQNNIATSAIQRQVKLERNEQSNIKKQHQKEEPPSNYDDSKLQQQPRRPDPPPDPPAQHVSKQPKAKYRHYNSKVLDRTQSITQEPKHLQPPAEYRHYSSTKVLERSTYIPASAEKPAQVEQSNNKEHLQPPSSASKTVARQGEWSTPLPFKKVNSNNTQSNFSSFFTTQTQNTTSSSQFWEQVENYGGGNAGVEKKEEEDYFDSHLPNQSSSLNQRPSTPTYVMEEEDVQPSAKSRRGSVRAKSSQRRRSKSRGLESINEDEISNAFSLKLPVHKDDISALEMNDSATVYFQKQQQQVGETNDVKNDSDYWKQQYLQLKQQTEAGIELSKSREEEMQHQEILQKDTEELEQEIMDVIQDEEDVIEEYKEEIYRNYNPENYQPSIEEEDAADITYGSGPEETHDTPIDNDILSYGNTAQDTESVVEQRRLNCTSPLDVFDGLHGVVDMDNCDFDRYHPNNQKQQDERDYGGGEEGRQSHQKQRVTASAIAAAASMKCASNTGLSQEDLDWMFHQASQARDASVHTMKKTARDMKNFADEIEDSNKGRKIKQSLLLGKEGCNTKIVQYKGFCATEMQDIANDLIKSQLHPAHQCNAPSSSSGQARQMSSALTDDQSDLVDLLPIGFVPLDGNNKSKTASNHDTGDTEGNDIALLEQYKKNRKMTSPNKSLADDLTAGPSRMSYNKEPSSPCGSELSENAKAIFEAALKHDTKGNKQRPQSRNSSLGAATNFSSHIPPDFATWFELPSPGCLCIPLLPLLNVSLRNSIDIYDASEISPQYTADDVVNLSYADFVREAQEVLIGQELDGDIFNHQSMGPIDVDGDDGSVRFANPSVHLVGISNAAAQAISRRSFQEAMDIYGTLLSSCSSTKSNGIVGQLIASTLHNLSVLNLWNHAYEEALPYCRESLRFKTELMGDSDGSSVNVWSNLGLLNYAMGKTSSALAAFRKSVQMSSKFHPEGHLTGRLVNNMACCNFTIGKLQLVQSQFKQALQLQKGDDGNDNSAGQDMFSISMSLFNIAVVYAAQHDNKDAISHLKACQGLQKILVESDGEVVRSITYYLDSMKNYTATPSSPPKTQPTHPTVSRNELEFAPNEPSCNDTEDAYHHQEHQRSIVPPTPNETSPVDVFTLRASQHNPFVQGGKQMAHPMLSLGNLKASATTAQRVHQSLEGCDNSTSIQSFRGGRELSLLCRRPPTSSTNMSSVSQNIFNYGLQSIKKREAQAELQKTLQRYGPRHPEVGKCEYNLGRLNLFSQSYKEAIKHLEASIRINSNALGPKHQDVASALMFKAMAQLAIERLEDASSSMARVHRMREELLGARHPEMGQILNNMACVEFELGEYTAAESMFQEALDLQREVFTTDPPFLKGVSIVLCNIAFLHAKAGSFSKALVEYEGALQIRQDILLEDNTLSDITNNMAHIMAIQSMQHGAISLDEVTNEYLSMLKR